MLHYFSNSKGRFSNFFPNLLNAVHLQACPICSPHYTSTDPRKVYSPPMLPVWTGCDAARPTVGASLERAAATHKVLGSSRTRHLEHLHAPAAASAPIACLLPDRRCWPARRRSRWLPLPRAAAGRSGLLCPPAPRSLRAAAALAVLHAAAPLSPARRPLPSPPACAPPMVSWMGVRLVGRSI